jgi:4-diphosphocytidyl-2-C-methyl-D-erythritol kinase
VSERDVVEVRAHAKINVFLRVLRRRDDGYHDIESLLLPVSLADLVVLRPDPAGVACGVFFPDGRPVGLDPDEDLAGRAAAALAETRWSAGRGIDVRVEKRIPLAAGLGGGSADAAAVLRGGNRLWGDPLPEDELARIAARIGSDVPALLHGGPVFVRGRGEIVEQASAAPMWWVLLPLAFGVSSAQAYGWWDEEGTTGPDSGPLIEAVAAGDTSRVAGALLFNDLQEPVTRHHPEINRAMEQLLNAGAIEAVMSGSGPTVAGLARDEEHAREIADAVPGTISVSGPA